MSDAHDNSSENLDEQEPEATEADQGNEGETEEPEVTAEDETEGSEGESETEGEPEPQEARREARGQPSREQRDRRVSEQDRINRLVQQEVDRRLANLNTAPRVDPNEQRRQLQERRQREIDEARLRGDDLSEIRDRHLREDYRMDAQAREFRETNQRFQDRYERLCDRNPVYDSVRDEVERTAAGLRLQGIAPDLELIAHNILGRRYAERAGREGTKQRRAAAEITRRNTVRAPSGHSSQAQPSRRSGRRNFAELSVEEMEQQLAGVTVRQGSST